MIKTFLSQLLTLLLATTITAQPSIEWQQTFGGSNWDEARSIQQTRDGGYIVTGTAGSQDGDAGPNNGYEDFWVLKLDSLGALQWKKLYGGSDLEEAFSIQLTSDGGYVVAGFAKSNDGDVSGHQGDFDAWVVKLDSAGEMQWQKCLGGTGWEDALDIQQTAEGGYIVAGRSGTPNGDVTVNHGSLDFWVVKLSNTGQIEWQKSLGGSFLDLAHSVSQTSDGGYIVAGGSNSPDGDVSNVHGNSDYWVVKLNFEGKIEWQKALGGTGTERANDIHQTQDGGYIVIGQSRSHNGDVSGNHGGFDYWVVKLNGTGAIEWQKALGGSGEDYGRAIEQTDDNGYVAIGLAGSFDGDVLGNDGGADFWVVKLSETGEIQWQKTLGGSMAETGHAVKQTKDGGFILAGDAWSNDGDVTGVQGKTDIWVVKLSPVSTSTSAPTLLPLEIFPNPAAQYISIKSPALSGIISLEEGAEPVLSISITDLLGREHLRSTFSDAQEVDISAIPGGLYVVTVGLPSGKVFAGRACIIR